MVKQVNLDRNEYYDPIVTYSLRNETLLGNELGNFFDEISVSLIELISQYNNLVKDSNFMFDLETLRVLNENRKKIDYRFRIEKTLIIIFKKINIFINEIVRKKYFFNSIIIKSFKSDFLKIYSAFKITSRC